MGLVTNRWRWLLPVTIFAVACQTGPSSPAQRTDSLRGPADGSLAATLAFRPARLVTGGADTLPVAWQSGLPVPSFDPQDRPRLNLAGAWRKERFSADHNLTMGTRGGEGLTQLEAEGQGRHRAEYDDSQWATHAIPGVESKMPKLSGDPKGPEPYENGVWYRRTFTVPADWQGRQITIQFLAVSYVADVWVNGHWVGYHEGGYTPFALDITDVVRPGAANAIAVRVDNPPWGTRIETVPGPKVDWWNYTGIIQDVYLEAKPLLNLVRVDVRPMDVSGNLRVTAVVHNAGNQQSKAELRLQVREANPAAAGYWSEPRASAIAGNPVGEAATLAIDPKAAEVVAARVSMRVPNPRLWTPETPSLYVIEAELVSGGMTMDRFSAQFGIRTLGTAKAQLLINGKPTFLRGVARHEEWPDSGRTATWAKILPDLKQIQAVYANFVRTAHYPNHPYTYLLTDRVGLAAWVEVPAWQFTNAEFSQQEKRGIADQMWREMMLMGADRPSIWFWSTQNESVAGRYRVAYNRRLVDDYRLNIDDGRLTSQSDAADRGGPLDASMDSLDVPAWTLYFGIFHGSTYYAGTADFLRKAHDAWPDRPLIASEFGIWSRGGDSSEEKQVEVFTETFRAFQEKASVAPDGTVAPDGGVAGVTWWTIFDWYTSHTKLQTMGLYHMDRQRTKLVTPVLIEAYKHWQ